MVRKRLSGKRKEGIFMDKVINFIKNNIDWKRVFEYGELKYLDEIKWGRNIIDYGEVV